MAQINFNSIYTAYYRKAFLFTLSYVHNDLVAEDIVSEAIIHLWELSKEREIPSVEAILITYIRSKSLNYLKHIQAQENVFQTLLDKGQRELEIRIYNPQIQISAESGTKRSIFRQKNKTKRSKKRLHTTLIKPEQKVNEDLCSGFIVS